MPADAILEVMKILHTSDWHLGRSFHGSSLHDISRQLLDELVATVRHKQVDAVLISGDVYDNATPSTETIELFNRALNGIVAAGAQVIISSGNHDSARRLGFGAQLFTAAGVHLITRAEQAWQEPVILERDGVRVGVYAIPYLNPRYHGPILNTAPTHQGVLTEVAGRIHKDSAARQEAGDIDYSVVLAHAFVTGNGSAHTSSQGEPVRSDSERDISVGGVEAVPASIFEPFDYTALGHLHGRQRVKENIRYSGSLLAFSFSEENHTKGGYMLNINRQEERITTTVEPVNWVTSLTLKTLRGSMNELLENPAFEPFEDAFCRIYLEQEHRPPNPVDTLRRRFKNIAVFEFRSTAPTTERSHYHRTRENITPQNMCEQFYRYVRQAPLKQDEEKALNTIIEEVTEAMNTAESEGPVCSSTD